MVLDFVVNIYEFIYILGGITGIIMGVDRLFKGEEEESDKLQWLAFGMSVLVLFSVILIIYNGDHITNYSAFFGFLFFFSTIARPLKKVPFAFVIAVIVGLGIGYLVLADVGERNILGSISLKWLVIAIVAVVIIVFIIGFFQEAAMDGFLIILGWSPIVIILSLVLIVQGITLLLEWPNTDGILYYLPG